MTCIKFLGGCPCPRCYVSKTKICDMGKKHDLRNRLKNSRNDNEMLHKAIGLSHKWIYQDGTPIGSNHIGNLLNPLSLRPIRVRARTVSITIKLTPCKQSAFSQRLFSHGFNHYKMFVPDLLHEFELGVWKATFTHLMRILYAMGGTAVQQLNKRYIACPMV